MRLPPPNRVAAYLTAAAALLGALAPVVADLDLTDTIGILGGVGAIVAVFREWLKGWRLHESMNPQPTVQVPSVWTTGNIGTAVTYSAPDWQPVPPLTSPEDEMAREPAETSDELEDSEPPADVPEHERRDLHEGSD